MRAAVRPPHPSAVVAVALALLLAAAGSARAWKPFEVEAGPAHWSCVTPVITVDGNLPDDLDEEAVLAAVSASLAAWEGLPCRPFAFGLEGPSWGARVLDDGTNWIRWARFSWPYGSKVLGATAVHLEPDTARIVDADVEINLVDVTYAIAAECDEEADEYDLQATITHELGHVLGLDHSEVPEATMYWDSGRGDCAKRDLADDDREGFCATYGDLPPPTPLCRGEAADDPFPDAGDVVEADPDGGDDADTGRGGHRDSGCSGAALGATGAFWGMLLLAIVAARRRPLDWARGGR